MCLQWKTIHIRHIYAEKNNLDNEKGQRNVLE